jgi:hypothetical protein
MNDELHEYHRGVRIVVRQQSGGLWQARAEGIGALSQHHLTADGALEEIRRYLDNEHDQLR